MVDVRRTIPLFVLILVGSLAACSDSGSPQTTPSGPGLWTIAFGHSGGLRVMIADDPTERARGLMGVTALPGNEGMAFVFPEATISRFWMKDTRIRLSIAFVDAHRRIVAIREMVPCANDPCPTYGAPVPYVMAVEANARWFRRHGIAPGDRMTGFARPSGG